MLRGRRDIVAALDDLEAYARSHGLKIADAPVAAAATTAGLHLWTLNERHYPMDDLRLYRFSTP